MVVSLVSGNPTNYTKNGGNKNQVKDVFKGKFAPDSCGKRTLRGNIDVFFGGIFLRENGWQTKKFSVSKKEKLGNLRAVERCWSV